MNNPIMALAQMATDACAIKTAINEMGQLNLGISQRNQTENIVSQLKTTCGCNYNCN